MNEFTRNPYQDFVDAPDLPLEPSEQPKQPCPVKRADAVAEDEIRYLWKPYILRGDVTILAAAGGTGKTYALCGIAAELSNGRFPLNPFETCAPVRVLFISAEDPDFILRERMRRAGADLGRIYTMDATDSMLLKLSDGQGNPRLHDLEQAIEEAKPDLVILDPLHAFVGSAVKMTEQSAIRPFMQALANLAKRHDCAIVDVAHVNKRPAGTNANDAILGATDVVNAARSVLRVIFDETEEHPNRRVLVHTKSNYAAMGASVAFEIGDDGSLTFTGFSAVTRADLEAAARSNRSLSEHMRLQEADRVAMSFVADRLEALAKEQSAPKQFYSYDTLRTCGISGKADIAPALPELRRRGVHAEFPNSAKRLASENGKAKRGIVLIRLSSETEGCV